MPKNPHANFSPVLNGYSGQEPFRFWCQMALPLTFDDSLSYYELLNKVVAYVNNTINDVATAEDNIDKLSKAYDELQQYVNDYFDDIDVEAELRTVLDGMAEDGSLDQLLDPIVAYRLPLVVGDQLSDVVSEQIGGAVAAQIGDTVEEQLPGVAATEIPDIVTDWLDDNVTPVGSAVVVDNSLTVQGAAADAKKTGDEISETKNNIDEIESVIYYFENFSPSWVNQKYLNYTNGEEGDNSSFAYFKTEIGDLRVIHVHTWLTSLGGICFYTNENVFIPGTSIHNPNTSGTIEFDEDVIVPENAYYIGVTTVIINKSSVSIKTKIKPEVNYLLKKALFPPTYFDTIPNQLESGIVHRDLTIYNPGTTYQGRHLHLTGLTTGDRIKVSGRSENTNYPCVIWVKSDNTTSTNLTGTGVNYSDRVLTAPSNAIEVYVNGNISVTPKIEIEKELTKEEINESLLYNKPECDLHIKAQYSSGVLSVKKRITSLLSACVKMSHVGGNNLWNFSQICLVDETPGKPMNDNFISNGTSITASATDWFGPYVVQAVNNIDGDDLAHSSYFTGGNHRTTNSGSGGAITATESAFNITIGGLTPENNRIYNTNEVKITWTNAVQANNTSKSDGSGRAVLNETWSVKIDKDGFHCENDIKANENIKMKIYYGMQVYFTGSTIIYKGGNTRTPVAIGDLSNSGNKSCRECEIYNENLKITLKIDDEDLGKFNESDATYSFQPSSNKLYPYLVYKTSIDNVQRYLEISENEHYFVKGCYKFW